jgi:predicted Zn-dependent protease
MTEDEKNKIEPKFNYAIKLWHNKKTNKALSILKSLEKEFPNQPTILGMIGAIYFSIKDWLNSSIYYEQTIKLSPKSELASIAFFHCLWNQERFDDAFSEASRFMKLTGFSKEYALIFEELDENSVFH